MIDTLITGLISILGASLATYFTYLQTRKKTQVEVKSEEEKIHTAIIDGYKVELEAKNDRMLKQIIQNEDLSKKILELTLSNLKINSEILRLKNENKMLKDRIEELENTIKKLKG